MKRLVIMLVLLHLGSALALAGQFGPAEPQTKPGQFSLGAGLFQSAEQWEVTSPGSRLVADVRQTRAFLQLNIGLVPGWESYVRLGGTNLKGDLRDTSFAPYGTIGLKGIAYRGKYLDMGGFVEGSYFSDYSDTYRNRLEIDNSYTVNAGIAFQREVEGALLYAGPFLHYRDGDFTSRISGVSGSVEAKNNLGGFVGIRWTPVYDIVIEGEVQYRDDLSGGLAISFLFGRL